MFISSKTNTVIRKLKDSQTDLKSTTKDQK